MDIQEAVKDLKQKKELSDLDDNFVKNRIIEYIKEKHLGGKFKEKQFHRTSVYDAMFKDLRRKLHESYGVFRSDSFKEHHSVKERLVYYKEIYYKIFSITGKPKKILDLGCGLNPLSYKYLGCKPYYYAADISNFDVQEVNKFFKLNKIKGKAFVFNLIDDSYKELPKANVCFLFKVLESLESIKKNISKSIIQDLNSDWIVVSFAKKAVGGKVKIKKAGRSWFRKILSKSGLYYIIFDIGDEIFFVIKRH